MVQAEKLTGIVLSALAILYVYLATEYPYGITHGVPGPGTLPVILGILLFLFSLGYTLRSFYRVAAEKKNSGAATPFLSLRAWPFILVMWPQSHRWDSFLLPFYMAC